MAVPFLTSKWVNAPAKMPHMTSDGHYDAALQLCAFSTNVTATVNLPTNNGIDVEGGSDMELFVRFGAIATGTAPTLDLTLTVSLDGGSTWNHAIELPQIVNTDDNLVIARKGYVPNATDPNGVNLRPKVRLEAVVGGAGGDFEILAAYLRPLSAGTDEALEAVIGP